MGVRRWHRNSVSDRRTFCRCAYATARLVPSQTVPPDQPSNVPMISTSPTTSGSSPTVVLVHGAWFGAFCWEPLMSALDGDNCRALAVELRGSGSRWAENGPDVTLADHIADVVSAIHENDLRSVVLVGHSYGGRVITGVIDQIPERISRAVYIDAHAPVLDDPGPSAARRAVAEEHDQMLPFDGVRLDAELVGGEDELERVRSMLVDHSFATLTAEWRHDLPAGLSRTYVHALGPDGEPFRRYADACRADSRWEYIEIDGPHMLIYSHPEQLADIICR